MHLIWENVIRNLLLLWTGEYKDLDTGREDYQLDKKVWEAIGEATAACGSTIPSAYGPRQPNIAQDKSGCTADSWSFWTLYIGPVLLNRRFKQEKYYHHFIDLVVILDLCLSFEHSDADLKAIKAGLIAWVQTYERIYYQDNPSRLSTCPITIHGLLHIADSIRAVGPVWVSWAFPMERYCGSLQPAITSRRFPYASINRYVLNNARLSHIILKYGLHDELSLCKPKTSRGAVSFENYPTCILIPPCRPASNIPSDVHSKIILALATRYGVTVATARKFVPHDLEEYGRVQILNDGDAISAANLYPTPGDDRRDASYVRYQLLVDKYAHQRRRVPEYQDHTFFGQLKHIFVLHLPKSRTLKIKDDETVLLAVIRSCDVTRKHPRLDIHYYKRDGRLEVVDLTAIQCLVGRIPVPTSNEWAIIDRSGTLARALYVEADGNVDDGE
ncbi:hypothetical protein PUNSTDRAFT_59555 [Punctularia strigosozonata HHB-11173 SS5]|uniref:uncharacterized protein n=1 Tax=Punctularia strigosozonata (strain HHB-11173) TaxID=741275 RepID=UPI0004417826|nr:uncharacterized protein PUNSTDRAFT_59555 [Punctularia strigosozonata HHB-11173 SS5]EIN14532.1 hypothetical protein PUNSTDRAFT_59555 [Punctularia strigosozonata HHB-11173 SS5]